jgi:hypothetical protein
MLGEHTRFNTWGPTWGLVRASTEAFFFYFMEARFRPSRTARTDDADRCGDAGYFPDADSQGRLINIRDPLRSGTCNAVSGGPACFPGNIIPANRINSSGRALLNMLPRATNFDRTFTQGQFNHSTQENADNPKLNNIVGSIGRQPATAYFTFKDWYSDQRGSEITADRPRGSSTRTTWSTDRAGA